MGRVTSRHPMVLVDLEGSTVRRTDTVAVEEPLEIRLDGRPFTVTMRTPGHDVELAHGLLHSEGIIRSREDVEAARYCVDIENLNVLNLSLRRPQAAPPGPVRSMVSYGGCGLCGKTSIDAVAAVRPPVHTGPAPAVDVHVLARMPATLRAHQEVFEATGGVHAAGLFTPDGELLVSREDVGRHNAVDKVLGWALMNGLDCSSLVLVVSSRASFEIVQKAAMSSVPVLACVSAPSSLAITAATELGITLTAFTRGTRLSICSHPERVPIGAPA